MSHDRSGRQPPTIADVARRARVSRATVSRVLNDYPHVRPSLRNAVRRAVDSLGYRPDQVARALARRETRTLGLIVTDVSNPFYSETAAVIVKTARAHGYTVILCDTDNIRELEAEYIEVLRQRRVDGIILGSVFLYDPPVERLIESGYPCLLYNRRLFSNQGNFVVLDSVRAGENLTRHLLELGHRRIGFIGTLPGLSSATDRLRGYRAALRAAGLHPEAALIRMGAVKPEIARQAARDLLKSSRRPTAVVGSSDLVALAIIEVAGELGLAVPSDLAVVGVDNIRIAAHRTIQLTTIDHRLEEMGCLATEGMLAVIRDPARFRQNPLQTVLEPRLIVRETCGAAARARAPGSGSRPTATNALSRG